MSRAWRIITLVYNGFWATAGENLSHLFICAIVMCPALLVRLSEGGGGSGGSRAIIYKAEWPRTKPCCSKPTVPVGTSSARKWPQKYFCRISCQVVLCICFSLPNRLVSQWMIFFLSMECNLPNVIYVLETMLWFSQRECASLWLNPFNYLDGFICSTFSIV